MFSKKRKASEDATDNTKKTPLLYNFLNIAQTPLFASVSASHLRETLLVDQKKIIAHPMSKTILSMSDIELKPTQSQSLDDTAESEHLSHSQNTYNTTEPEHLSHSQNNDGTVAPMDEEKDSKDAAETDSQTTELLTTLVIHVRENLQNARENADHDDIAKITAQYHEKKGDKTKKKEDTTIPLENILDAKIALCRHFALYFSCLLARKVGTTPGECICCYTTNLSGAAESKKIRHMVVIYKNQRGEFYLIDPTHRVVLDINTFLLKEKSKQLQEIKACYPNSEGMTFLHGMELVENVIKEYSATNLLEPTESASSSSRPEKKLRS